MQFLDKPPKKIFINLTSLIDVLFILIIFFTVSSTFLEQPGIELKLPDAESSESYTAQKVIVYVDREERIFLNDNPLIFDNLAESVKNMISAQVDKSVILSADEKVSHGLIIKIMDALRKNGIYKLIISTEKPI